jgi:Protein of unknown function (DUF3631)
MSGDARNGRRVNGTNVEALDLADAYAAGLVTASVGGGAQRPRRSRGGVDTAEPADTYDDVPDEPGHQVLDDVAAWLSAHVAYASEHHAPAVTLWAAHSHALDAAASTPRLAFVSPEPGSGKTRSLELLELLVHQGRHVLSMTPAALFRIVEAERPTILLDEVDAIFGPRAKDHEDLRALINAGHRPGASVLRVAGEGGNMRPREYRAYCAVALAGLGHLPPTIATRAITIPMRRRAPDELVRPYRERITRPEGEQLRRRLAAWVHRYGDYIPEAPDLPAGVTDRPADCWEPLVAIGDAAGGRWPATARAACTALVQAAGEDQSPGVRLLADLRTAFGADTRLATAELLARLTVLDDAPWADQIDGKSDKARGSWLARKLRPYGISSRTLRIGDSTPKGYEAGDFSDTWRRYLLANG